MSFFPSNSETAYAKVNLALHLVERLSSGYHRLDSVAAFVGVGDRLQATTNPQGTLQLVIDGPYGEGLPTENNLILRAAHCLQQQAKLPLGAHIRLSKQIPVGAGLGGGSADAAAALRLLNRLWGLHYNDAMLAELGGQLGADIPVCVFSQSARMEGIGELLSPIPHIPPLPLVLVYPNVPLWTPDVFRAMTGKSFSGRLSAIPAMGAALEDWMEWLHKNSNDLEQAAHSLNPHIAIILSALNSQEGCTLARMSGSGSACFGLFATHAQAVAAEQKLQSAQPNWWVRASQLLVADS